MFRSKRKRRCAFETLEKRRVLATNILLDFTPATIEGEYEVAPLTTGLDGASVNRTNSLSSYDRSDAVPDTQDAHSSVRDK